MGSALPPATGSLEQLLAAAAAAHEEGRRSEAVGLLGRALALAPGHHDALCRYAMLALAAGRIDVALAAASNAAAAHPRSALAHNLRGVALRGVGRLADAIASLRDAVAADPQFFDAQVNLGNALLDAGDPQAALACYERALAIDPRAATVHNNAGNAYRELRDPAAAIAAYERALVLDPRYAYAHANLGNILKDLGDADGAIAACQRSLALQPDAPDVVSNLLLAQIGLDGASSEAIADSHRAYGAHFARLLPPLALPARPRRVGRLRVGYVSADFRKHAVAMFFEPLLEAHDRAGFEIHCYYNQPRGDEVTERLRARAEHFVPVAGLADRALAERIVADGIDILVDLTGHTADNRLPLFFRRPAPVQATWLGYLGPTGVPTIDWRITDVHADPPGRPDPPGLERPWRLPRTLWCYRPHADAPDVAPLPAASAGRITFANLNNPGKTSGAALAAWSAVLRAVPDSRLLLLTAAHAGRIADLRRQFAAQGIDSERVEFVTRVPLAEYLALYARIDIALDPFPYVGGATTCDAAWMGVPVVTLAGDRPFARGGASILANLELPELVAPDVDGYIATAVALAGDVGRLALLRAELRPRMRASPLTNAPQFARDFEAALQAMWELRARAGELASS
jgi:predicted O-linked N-acetylglucosamine transferase (SPINDLY family)